MGAFQLIGGGAECCAGMTFAVVTSPTGAGAIGGGLVALHGADVATAGVYALWYGEPRDTLTSQSLQAVGVPQNVANGIDAGLSIGGMGSIGATTKTLTAAGRVMSTEMGAARSVPKTATAASSTTKAAVKATSPTVTESSKLGDTVLRGVDDDMFVHFSQIEKLNSIEKNGLVAIKDRGVYMFKAGEIKGRTLNEVRAAIGPGTAGGEKIDIAITVSPNVEISRTMANWFYKDITEYIIEVNSGERSIPFLGITGVSGAVP